MQTIFDSPGGTDPVALDLGSMGKGQAWVNGHHLGRYWLLLAPSSGCSSCDYRGPYNSDKCRTDCGEPSQRWQVIVSFIASFFVLIARRTTLSDYNSCARISFPASVYISAISVAMPWLSHLHFPCIISLVLMWSWQHRYHIPRAWLQPSGNLLVLFEEIGGDVTTISLVTRSAHAVCAHIDQSQPPPVQSWTAHLSMGALISSPAEALLECAAGQHISHIKFASFGNPRGSCGHFHHGKCHAMGSSEVVQKVN